MKRTLAIWLLLGVATLAVAQNPQVVQNVKKAVASVNSQKPAPGTKADTAKVRVMPVPAKRVVAVNASHSAAAAKPAAASAHAPQVKVAVAPAHKVNVAVAGKAAPAKIQVARRPAVARVAAAKDSRAAAKPMAKTPFAARAGKHSEPIVAAKSNSKDKKPAATKQARPATVAVNESKPAKDEKKTVAKKINAASRRDPFISPVVAMGAVGSGCSTGKRCLAIDQIALRGVVQSETGMIAVVVNALDKAYFLRENDPVFNGYVVKITGDSIVFKETFHDRLGKELTRDVTKTLTRPAA